MVRQSNLPIFIPFMDGFPQIMDQNTDHVSRTKSIADMYCSVCFRILYSKIFNNIHEKWFIQVDSFPISSGKLHLYKFSFRTWQVNVEHWFSMWPPMECTCGPCRPASHVHCCTPDHGSVNHKDEYHRMLVPKSQVESILCFLDWSSSLWTVLGPYWAPWVPIS